MSYTNTPDDGVAGEMLAGEMPSRQSTPRPRWRAFDRRRAALAAFAFAVVACIGAFATVKTTRASDHQDTPEVELNPRMDINDLYVFPGSSSDRTTLVLTTSSPITPAQGPTSFFDPNLLYQIKVDNNGDGIEDKVIQVTFRGNDANQQVTVRGPVAPNEAGTRNTLIKSGSTVTGGINASIGTATGMQVFAGLRDDPFWIDLEQFFRIIPDRKPVSGSLSQLPDAPSASGFRPKGQAVDFLRGLDCLAIVVEVPTSMLTQGGTPKLGVWATISR